MIIDIFQDTVCPWCRIGKKHLLDAIRAWEGDTIQVRYRTFFLDPSIPKEGLPFREAMAALKGPQAVDQLLRHVTEAGKASGVTFHFDKVRYRPNTYASHTLLKLAPEGKAAELVEAVFQAYFEEGRDIGNLDVLVDIGAQCGLDAEAVREAIESDRMKDEIAADLALARELQITGVPFFVIDNKLALSGAHPVENFLRAFRRVAEEASS
ncbi:DsbA family oxidoreductase [Brevibacillus sp. SYP-B805]|nr:DsbA family oxidoreductase [Brevibacillus sp. SYP-B805]